MAKPAVENYIEIASYTVSQAQLRVVKGAGRSDIGGEVLQLPAL